MSLSKILENCNKFENESSNEKTNQEGWLYTSPINLFEYFAKLEKAKEDGTITEKEYQTKKTTMLDLLQNKIKAQDAIDLLL